MIGLRVDDDITLALREPPLDAAGFRVVERNRERLARVAAWAPHAGSPERTDAFSALSLKQYADGEAIVAWIVEHGRIVGDVDASISGDTAEMGYWLDTGAEHRGLASRSAARLIDHLVLRRGVRRVVMRIPPWNAASRALAKRLGLRREGLLKAAHSLGDRREDVELWGILAAAWRRGRDVLAGGGPDFALPIDDELELVLPHAWFTEAAVELIEHNRDRLRRWEAWAHEESSAGSGSWYDARLRAFGRRESLPGLVRRRGSDADLLGSIGGTVTEEGAASVGYWVDGSVEGMGVATRAVTALIDELTGSWGMQRLWLSTAVHNQRSRRLAEKLGFTAEATCAEYQLVGGVPHDCVIYGQTTSAPAPA
ncbi:MAG: GNAT family N-acetyltransferase [Nocardioidaceae bacterium]